MTSMIHDISNIRFTMRTAWFATVLLLIMAYPQVKELVAFILSKLYEFIIQQNAIKP